MNKIEIKRIDYDFTVCKVTDYSLVNQNTEYCFIGKNGRRKFAGMFDKRCAAKCHQKNQFQFCSF